MNGQLHSVHPEKFPEVGTDAKKTRAEKCKVHKEQG